MKVKTVGRGHDNDIPIKDENVSRIHLQLVEDDNGNISVVDLGSTNGTYVNGRRIDSETRLQPGDEVRIGDTILPWQQYFPKAPAPVSPLPPSQPQKPKRNLMWIIVAGSILLVLLVVGGVSAYINNMRSESEKQEQQMANMLDAARKDYVDLKQQNEQTSNALYAEKRRREAFEVQIASSNKKKKLENTGSSNDKQKPQSNTEPPHPPQSNTLPSQSEFQGDTTLKKTESDGTNANKDSEIETPVSLEKKFETQLMLAKNHKLLEKVCNVLGIQDAQNDKDRETKIKEKFNQAETAKLKDEIIEKIRKITSTIKQQNTSIGVHEVGGGSIRLPSKLDQKKSQK